MAQEVQVVFFGSQDRTYAYRWEGVPLLQVGDRVLLPPNWRHDEPFSGTVASLEPSDYRGPLVAILERLG